MVMKGAVRLFDSIDGEEVLVDLCDEGDLFGVRAIFGTSAYLLSAQVVEESLLLPIPSESVEQLSQEREKAEKLLKMYIAQEVAIHFISNIFTELNDALIVKAIEFSVAGMKKEGMEMPDIEFCWLSLGSEGRKEQLLRTDQDNAILFRDPQDEASRQAAQQAFLELDKRVSAILVACGFEPCPAQIMASNPDWCQPLSGWMNYFRKWIGTPEPKALMNSTIFFDFRPVYGSTALALEM